MADEAEGLRAAGGGDSADPSAVALAFGAASLSERVAAKAETYLEKQAALSDRQSVLVELQAEELGSENRIHHWSLRVRHVSDIMKLTFEIGLALLVIAIAVFVVAAVWTASEADGVVVESFSVPPALVQAGLNGDVVAGDVTNRLAEMRRSVGATTIGATRDIRSDSKDDVRIEIPETGISLTALWRDLRDWLGSERHATGSVRDVGGGKIAVVVSLTGSDPVTITGDAANAVAWEQEAAEALFSAIEPTEFIFYLDNEGRYAEALALAKHTTEHGQAVRYGLTGSQLPFATGDFTKAAAYARLAVMLAPQVQVLRSSLMSDDEELGWSEEELHAAQSILPLRESDQSVIEETHQGYEVLLHRAAWHVALLSADYANASFSCFMCAGGEDFAVRARVAALRHDAREGKRLLALARTAADADPDDEALASWSVAAEIADWQGAQRAATELERALDKEFASAGYAPRYGQTVAATHATPFLALAEAHLGDLAEAHHTIDATPRDCYDCVRARGAIAALERNWVGAAFWFAEAVRQAPDIPFAYADWGEMLLREGKYDAAIDKFREANLKGPHFADPLEMWGEALMQKSRSDLALAKFEEANKDAPNWGRLHLEWGKALMYVGKKAEAQQQFAVASHLDLSSADAAALAEFKHG